MQRRQLDLVGGQGQAPVQRRQLVRREVAGAEMAHLALAAQRLEGAGQFVEIGQRIGPVDQQQVEVVGAQCLQRLLH